MAGVCMFGEPIRWILMALIAACGYFTIESSDMTTRAFAFTFSAVFWQAYCVTLMWEADMLRNSGMKKKRLEAERHGAAAKQEEAAAGQNKVPAESGMAASHQAGTQHPG